MTEMLVDFPRTKWAKQRNLKLDKSFRDALADLWRRRWPTHTAKEAARAYDLTVDRAREGVAGRASLTTIEQVIKRGGIGEGLALIEAVAGESAAHYFAELRKQHDEQGAQIAALASGPFPVGPDRTFGDPDTAGALGRRVGGSRDRMAGVLRKRIAER